jgi:hypothetical protein
LDMMREPDSRGLDPAILFVPAALVRGLG